MDRYISVVQYHNWLNRMYTNCPLNDIAAITAHTLGYFRRNDYMVTYNNKQSILRIINTKTGKVGWSKKNKRDEFNSKIALAIAWARYCKYNIPKVHNCLSLETFANMKSGTPVHDTYFNDDYRFVGINPVFNNQVVLMPDKNGVQTFVSIDVCSDRFVLKE